MPTSPVRGRTTRNGEKLPITAPTAIYSGSDPSPSGTKDPRMKHAALANAKTIITRAREIVSSHLVFMGRERENRLCWRRSSMNWVAGAAPIRRTRDSSRGADLALRLPLPNCHASKRLRTSELRRPGSQAPASHSCPSACQPRPPPPCQARPAEAPVLRHTPPASAWEPRS